MSRGKPIRRPEDKRQQQKGWDSDFESLADDCGIDIEVIAQDLLAEPSPRNTRKIVKPIDGLDHTKITARAVSPEQAAEQDAQDSKAL